MMMSLFYLLEGSLNATSESDVALRRTGRSQREVGRVEVPARVKSQELRLIDAAALMRLESSADESAVDSVGRKRQRG